MTSPATESPDLIGGEPSNGPSPASPSSTRKWIWLAVRLSVAAVALAWTFNNVALDDMIRAAKRVSAFDILLSTTIALTNLCFGAVRWRVLLAAYGATRPPSLAYAAKVYIIGNFYNTLIPGNVTGDLVRAHVTRDAFEGTGGAYLIVLIERGFGLAGLLLLGASIVAFRPIQALPHLPLFAVLGIVAALAGAAAPIVLRALGPRLPGRIGKLAREMPKVQRPSLLLAVLAMSCVTQTMVALQGHVLFATIDSRVGVADSLVFVPLAMIALYFPATVAGLGVREAAFVSLFGTIGVARADATAASLAFLAVQLLTALVGVLLHLVSPMARPTNPSTTESAPKPEIG